MREWKEREEEGTKRTHCIKSSEIPSPKRAPIHPLTTLRSSSDRVESAKTAEHDGSQVVKKLEAEPRWCARFEWSCGGRSGGLDQDVRERGRTVEEGHAP